MSMHNFTDRSEDPGAYSKPFKSTLVIEDGVEYFIDCRGHKRRRSSYAKKNNPFRKIVPKRKFDNSAAGKLNRFAYHADIPRKELAAAMGVGLAYTHQILEPKSRVLKPWMIDAMAKALSLTNEETRDIHVTAAREAGWKI